MNKVTREFLRDKGVCSGGYEFWCKNCEGLTNEKQILKLAEKHFEWANWLIVRIMSYEEYVAYAIFAAELVLYIYEKKYPNNKAPRQAIEAAKKCLSNPTTENKKAAAAAAAAAYAYADAYAAAAAAAAYAYAADAAYAAYAAYAADAYAADAADAAYAAGAYEIKNKIINYGLKLLKQEV